MLLPGGFKVLWQLITSVNRHVKRERRLKEMCFWSWLLCKCSLSSSSRPGLRQRQMDEIAVEAAAVVQSIPFQPGALPLRHVKYFCLCVSLREDTAAKASSSFSCKIHG